MSQDVTPRALTPAAGLPAHPPAALPSVVGVHPPVPYTRLDGDIAQQLRPENQISLSKVDFTAACPRCGEDADWTASRTDTEPGFRVRISCARCRRDLRRHLRSA